VGGLSGNEPVLALLECYKPTLCVLSGSQCSSMAVSEIRDLESKVRQHLSSAVFLDPGLVTSTLATSTLPECIVLGAQFSVMGVVSVGLIDGQSGILDLASSYLLLSSGHIVPYFVRL
jgi:hypothetical protein